MKLFSRKKTAFLFLAILFWLTLFDIFAFRIVQKWQIFFSYFEGYRLPSSIAAFTPFVANIVQNDQAFPKIIFTGDSTSGGLLYHHSQAIPSYLNQLLKKHGLNSHTYNLALTGAHLSEQYFLIKEMIDEADIFIFPIHYSFFSGRGDNGNFILHPTLVDFLPSISAADVKPLKLKIRLPVENYLEQLISKFWFTYRVRKILPYITFGKPFKYYIKDEILNFFTSIRNKDKKNLLINPDLAFSQQDKDIQDEILRQNELLWLNMEKINSQNINLVYLKKIGDLAKWSRKKFLAYFVPIDLGTVKQYPAFKPEIYQQIVETAKLELTAAGIPYIDFNDINTDLTTEDFYNPDHLLPQGNYKAAVILARKIKHDF